MNRTLPLSIALLFTASQIMSQVVPPIEWQRCLGGTANEAAFSVEQTSDAGFIIAGYSDSNDGDVTGNHGQQDYWVIKLDAVSNLQWQKSLGGNSIDQANSVKQLNNGDYIVAGYTYSNNGDVTGNHGSSDYWVVKLDSAGNLLWQKALGGSGDDGATSILETADGGFIVAGYSSSNNGDVTGNHGMWDYWIAKLSSSGNLDWQKSYGGSSNDVAYSIQQTNDAGYIICGYSESSDGDVSGNHGARDYWIVKADSSGSLEWESYFGGSSYDEAYSVYQTSNGFVVGGFAGSSDGDVTGNHGAYDYWVVMLDTVGDLLSNICYGGSSNDQPFSMDHTSDDGFVIAGQSYSNNGDVTGNHGGYDFWVVKADVNGTLEWQKSIGGTSDEYGPYGIRETFEHGFIMSGSSLSNDGDVSGNHGGSFYGDCWIVNLAGGKPTGIITISSSFSIYPNPVESQLVINLPTSSTETLVSIYDLNGKIISLSATFHDKQILINTNDLPGGFYSLELYERSTGNVQVRKFIKAD